MAEADGADLVGMTVLPQKLVQRSDQETDAMAGPWVLLVTAQVPAGLSTGDDGMPSCWSGLPAREEVAWIPYTCLDGTPQGQGKRVHLSEFSVTTRGRRGMKALVLNKGDRLVDFHLVGRTAGMMPPCLSGAEPTASARPATIASAAPQMMPPKRCFSSAARAWSAASSSARSTYTPAPPREYQC